MMPLELRVLSGLHKGASLTLDEHAVLVGSGEESDVMLLDTGVAQRHLYVEPLGLDRWTLRAGDAPIADAHGKNVDTLVAGPDEPARVLLHGTDVWIDIVRPEDAWTPVEPIRDIEPSHSLARAPDADFHPDSVAFHPSPAIAAAKRLNWATLASAAIALAFGIGVFWYATSAPDSDHAPLPDASKPDPETIGSSNPGASTGLRRGAPTASSLAHAIETVKEYLQDRNLDQRVQCELRDGKLHLDGVLNSDEMNRFTPMIALLKERVGNLVPIEVNVMSAEQALPFRVVQVVAGRVPEILTEDGHQLFLGDTFDGYTLVAVQPKVLIFEGKRHVELPW